MDTFGTFIITHCIQQTNTNINTQCATFFSSCSLAARAQTSPDSNFRESSEHSQNGCANVGMRMMAAAAMLLMEMPPPVCLVYSSRFRQRDDTCFLRYYTLRVNMIAGWRNSCCYFENCIRFSGGKLPVELQPNTVSNYSSWKSNHNADFIIRSNMKICSRKIHERVSYAMLSVRTSTWAVLLEWYDNCFPFGGKCMHTIIVPHLIFDSNTKLQMYALETNTRTQSSDWMHIMHLSTHQNNKPLITFPTAFVNDTATRHETENASDWFGRSTKPPESLFGIGPQFRTNLQPREKAPNKLIQSIA